MKNQKKERAIKRRLTKRKRATKRRRHTKRKTHRKKSGGGYFLSKIFKPRIKPRIKPERSEEVPSEPQPLQSPIKPVRTEEVQLEPEPVTSPEEDLGRARRIKKQLERYDVNTTHSRSEGYIAGNEALRNNISKLKRMNMVNIDDSVKITKDKTKLNYTDEYGGDFNCLITSFNEVSDVKI